MNAGRERLRIGLPRGLYHFQFEPAIRAFFETLGAETVISGPTSPEMLALGCSRVVGEICLPVKIFCGHVHSLAGACDRIFVPSLHCLKDGAFLCPKFIGLPDLVRAAIPEAPPILDPDIDATKGKGALRAALDAAARPLSRDRKTIDRAFRTAREAQREFEGRLTSRREDSGSPGGGTVGSGPTIALLGHPYLIHDDFFNHNLVGRLGRLGVRIVCPETVPGDDLRKAVAALTGKPYWGNEEDVIGAGEHFLSGEADGAILACAFGCGPDSMMISPLQRRAGSLGKPFLSLVLDEHTADGGVMTRLEAFVDTVKRRKAPVVRVSPAAGSGFGNGERIRHLCVPNFSHLFPAFRASADMMGVTLAMPPVTGRTVSLGVRHSPEFACFPFKVILGTFIEALEKGADTLFMVTSSNACRMGYFTRIQERILRDMGYRFRFLTAGEAEKGVFGILRLVKRQAPDDPWGRILAAYRLGMAKLRALDALERKLGKIRAVESEKGAADRIRRRAVQAIDEATAPSSVAKLAASFLDELARLPRNGRDPLRVGVVGELFVVMDPFVNLDLEAKLGRLGVEVWRTRSTFLSEYVRFGVFLGVLDAEKRMLRELARPCLARDVGGHGLETVGEHARLARAGFDGLIHVAPFTCMPESVAQNVLLKSRDDLPVLDVICDEQLGEAGLTTRLEAFVDLMERRRRREKGIRA